MTKTLGLDQLDAEELELERGRVPRLETKGRHHWGTSGEDGLARLEDRNGPRKRGPAKANVLCRRRRQGQKVLELTNWQSSTSTFKKYCIKLIC